MQKRHFWASQFCSASRHPQLPQLVTPRAVVIIMALDGGDDENEGDDVEEDGEK